MLNRTDIATGLTLRELGLRLVDYDNTRTKKNAVYLAQTAGVGLGYYFWWSPNYCVVEAHGELRDCLAKLSNASEDNWKDNHLDEKSRERLSRLKEKIIDPYIARPQLLSTKLELLTSVHFIYEGNRIKKPARIQRILEEYGWLVGIEHVKQAIELLKEESLFGEH